MAAYIDNSLSSSEQQQVDFHLLECGECLDALLDAKAALENAEHVILPADEMKKLLELVPERRCIAGWFRDCIDRFTELFAMPAPAVALCLLLVCCIGFFAGVRTSCEERNYSEKVAAAMMFVVDTPFSSSGKKQ
jgi:hypothetical protein